MAAGGRRRGRLILILALILIVVLFGILFLMRGQLFGGSSPAQPAAVTTPTPQQEMQSIVIAAQPIPRGTTITADVLGSIMYPKNEMFKGLFFTDQASVIGKRALFDMQQGTPITSGLITTSTSGSLAALQIPQGMVAISIPINRLSAVSYALQPGDHVNVLASLLLLDIDPNFQSRLPNKIDTAADLGPNYVNCGGDQATCLPSGGTLTLKIDSSNTDEGRTQLDASLQKPIYVGPSEPQRPRLVSQAVVQDAIVLGIGEFPVSAEQQLKEAQPVNVTPSPTPVVQAVSTQAPPQEEKRPEVISIIVTHRRNLL